jgi:hypothetical protein
VESSYDVVNVSLAIIIAVAVYVVTVRLMEK